MVSFFLVVVGARGVVALPSLAVDGGIVSLVLSTSMLKDEVVEVTVVFVVEVAVVVFVVKVAVVVAVLAIALFFGRTPARRWTSYRVSLGVLCSLSCMIFYLFCWLLSIFYLCLF